MDTPIDSLKTHSCIDKFINDFNFKIESDITMHIDYILSCIDLTSDDTFESLRAAKEADRTNANAPEWTFVLFDFQTGSIPHFLFDEIRKFFKTSFKTSDNKYIVEVTPNFAECKIFVRFQKTSP